MVMVMVMAVAKWMGSIAMAHIPPQSLANEQRLDTTPDTRNLRVLR